MITVMVRFKNRKVRGNMRIYDSVIVGSAAVEFNERLSRPDQEAIRQRDNFISDITVENISGDWILEVEEQIEEMISSISREEISAKLNIKQTRAYQTYSIHVGSMRKTSSIARIMGYKNAFDKQTNSYNDKAIKDNISKKNIYVEASILPNAS